MTDKTLESVSALMDGETGAGATDAIHELLRDEGARRAWARYHLISDCLRGTLPERIDAALAGRISAAVGLEPTVLAPVRKTPPRRILKSLAGLAVAASVAAMAIFAIQYSHDSREAQPLPVVASQAPVVQPARSITFASGHPGAQPARAQTIQGRTSARLNRYLVNYNEYRSNAPVQGMFPYVRIVAPENNE